MGELEKKLAVAIAAVEIQERHPEWEQEAVLQKAGEWLSGVMSPTVGGKRCLEQARAALRHLNIEKVFEALHLARKECRENFIRQGTRAADFSCDACEYHRQSAKGIPSDCAYTDALRALGAVEEAEEKEGATT